MLTNNQQPQRKLNKFWRYFGFIFVAAQALGWFFVFIHPKRWRRYLSGQKREIRELASGQEGWRHFWRDSGNLFKDVFIPHHGNGFKPKVLRSKSLMAFATVAVVVKILVTGFLFLTYPTPAQLSAIVSANMISLINQSRAQEGLLPVKENLILSKYALEKGMDMVSRNYFAHDTPEGKRPWQWIDKGEYDYVYAGENLAMDFTSAEAVHDAFLKSPSHKRNILNTRYREVGIAVISGRLEGHQTTLLVEFFGTQRKDISGLAVKKPGTQTATAPKKETTQKESAKKTPSQVKPKTAGAADEEFLPPADPPATLPDMQDESVEVPANEAAPAAAAADAVGGSDASVVITLNDNQAAKTLADWVIEYSNIFFVAFLIFMLISFILNLMIKIQVQHTSVILQSAALIALLLAMVFLKFHFVETVPDQLLIL